MVRALKSAVAHELRAKSMLILSNRRNTARGQTTHFRLAYIALRAHEYAPSNN